jgi:hypothetical protein
LFLLKYLMAFVVHYKKPSIIKTGLAGFRKGLTTGTLSPKVIDTTTVKYRLVE